MALSNGVVTLPAGVATQIVPARGDRHRLLLSRVGGVPDVISGEIFIGNVDVLLYNNGFLFLSDPGGDIYPPQIAIETTAAVYAICLNDGFIKYIEEYGDGLSVGASTVRAYFVDGPTIGGNEIILIAAANPTRRQLMILSCPYEGVEPIGSNNVSLTNSVQALTFIGDNLFDFKPNRSGVMTLRTKSEVYAYMGDDQCVRVLEVTD